MGLIGLGNMGTAIAERLLDGGYELVVSNRTPGRSEALEERVELTLDGCRVAARLPVSTGPGAR